MDHVCIRCPMKATCTYALPWWVVLAGLPDSDEFFQPELKAFVMTFRRYVGRQQQFQKECGTNHSNVKWTHEWPEFIQDLLGSILMKIPADVYTMNCNMLHLLQNHDEVLTKNDLNRTVTLVLTITKWLLLESLLTLYRPGSDSSAHSQYFYEKIKSQL